MIAIERITLETAMVFKDVRLRALQDSPTAFSSTIARESKFPDEEWSKRAVRWSSDGSAIFLAMDGDAACGMIGAYKGNEQSAQVISMWGCAGGETRGRWKETGGCRSGVGAVSHNARIEIDGDECERGCHCVLLPHGIQDDGEDGSLSK